MPASCCLQAGWQASALTVAYVAPPPFPATYFNVFNPPSPPQQLPPGDSGERLLLWPTSCMPTACPSLVGLLERPCNQSQAPTEGVHCFLVLQGRHTLICLLECWLVSS